MSRLVWSRRQACPALGTVVNTVPPRVQDQQLRDPINKDIAGVESIPVEMRQKIGHFYLQQAIQQQQADGLVFGAGSSPFSGDTNIL